MKMPELHLRLTVSWGIFVSRNISEEGYFLTAVSAIYRAGHGQQQCNNAYKVSEVHTIWITHNA